jgi:hypothetical protein
MKGFMTGVLIMWGPGLPVVETLKKSLAKQLGELGWKIHMISNSTITVPLDDASSHAVTVIDAPVDGSYQDTFQSLLDKASYAIALIAEDKPLRGNMLPNTDRGNVWLEWCYWISIRSDRTLLTVFVETDYTSDSVSLACPPHWSKGAFGDAGARQLLVNFKGKARRLSQERANVATKQIIEHFRLRFGDAPKAVPHA